MDTTTLHNPNKPHRPNRPLEALDQGDLVRLLADVDAGRISKEEFEEAMDRHSRKGWLRRLFAKLFPF